MFLKWKKMFPEYFPFHYFFTFYLRVSSFSSFSGQCPPPLRREMSQGNPSPPDPLLAAGSHESCSPGVHSGPTTNNNNNRS